MTTFCDDFYSAAFWQVSTMSGLSSDEADTVVHYGLDKESKYRVCAGLLGQLWRASTDGKMAPLTETTQKEVSKELVRAPEKAIAAVLPTPGPLFMLSVGSHCLL